MGIQYPIFLFKIFILHIESRESKHKGEEKERERMKDMYKMMTSAQRPHN